MPEVLERPAVLEGGKSEACPILGLDNEFPNRLSIVHHPPSDRYICFCEQGVYGLAAFSSAFGALHFMKHILVHQLPGLKILNVSFEEAVDIAKDRPHPVVSLMLLDDIDDPKIFYVK